MGSPIKFKPQPVDPGQELMRKLDEAPRTHAEALLVAWETLQTAHDKGILDLLKGLIGGRDIIATKVSEGMNTPEATVAIRNGIALARVLGTVDPEMLHRLSKHLDDASKEHKEEARPPSLWQLFKRATSDDGRRGISYATRMLVALGRATRSE